MIEITRALARHLKCVFRKGVPMNTGRSRRPPLVLQAGKEGLRVRAHHPEVALEFHLPGNRPADVMGLPAEALDNFEGRTEDAVALETTEPGTVQARWDDGGVPQVRKYAAAELEKAPSFPEEPKRWFPVDPALLKALDAAAQTANAEPGGRFALSSIQLRGKKGDVVATDGRQLLVQAGFDFPWEDDVLIPRSPIFGCREFAGDGDVLLGRTKTHVALKCGPWTLFFMIDGNGRYPDTEAVLPRNVSAAARLIFDDKDALFLTSILPKLPGVGESGSPITLDLAHPPAVRARAESSDQVTETPLASSTASGPPLRLCIDRRLLHRSLALGFRDMQVVSADAPVVFRDERRLYLWIPHDKKGAIPPGADVIRVGTANGPFHPSPPPSIKKEPDMPPPTNNGHTSGAGPVRDPQVEKWDLEDVIAETESLRGVVQDASVRASRLLAALKHQRRQSRAVRAAMQSLQQLRLAP